MNAEEYERWSAPLRDHPRARGCILAANKALTYLGYAIYPLLLAILAAQGDPFFWRALVVPACCFIGVSLLRKTINRARPYEALSIDPVIHKDTHGKSFPSRHAFSMAMIAMAWLYWCAPVGIALLALSLAMALVRVMGGVHYPSDVCAGILIAVACGIIGFWLV